MQPRSPMRPPQPTAEAENVQRNAQEVSKWFVALLACIQL